MNRCSRPTACFWLVVLSIVMGGQRATAAPPAGAEWELVFREEFEGDTAELDKNWEFQNGPSGHILCSRWRENVIVENGVCRLLNRKESRGGQDWTSGSMWTRRPFRYGYFECGYKYGATTGLNNSFWIMTRGRENPSAPVRFEIDINEGHYPNEIATNIHRWSGKHIAFSRAYKLGVDPKPVIQLEAPVETDRIRLLIRDTGRSRVSELRVFPFSRFGYPPITATELAPDASWPPNVASLAKAEASSVLGDKYTADKAVDGKLDPDSRWVSDDKAPAPHTLTLRLDKKYPVGCVQLVSGTKQGDQWVDPIGDYVVQWWDGTDWRDIAGSDSRRELVDLSRDFHTYALEWNEQELVYYFDGRELRRAKNEFCQGEASVWLSSAIMTWAGPVTDRIDGTSMDVDYVRVYQRKR